MAFEDTRTEVLLDFIGDQLERVADQLVRLVEVTETMATRPAPAPQIVEYPRGYGVRAGRTTV